MLANEEYICPFCGWKDKLINFIIKNRITESISLEELNEKKSIIYSMDNKIISNPELKRIRYTGKSFQCPDCKQIMRRNTLLRNISAREWGMWLYASIRIWNKHGESFYDRIKKNRSGGFVLADRLKLMGEEITSEFWNGWKEAKTMDSNEWKKIVDNAYIPERKQSKLVFK